MGRNCLATGTKSAHLFCFFFFSSRRRHTRSLCDWSSDVCSSDLVHELVHRDVKPGNLLLRPDGLLKIEIGRASCRERVEISVVAVSLKKKNRIERYAIARKLTSVDKKSAPTACQT